MTESFGKPGRWLWPLGGAGLCLGLGIASGLSTMGGDGSWYRALEKTPGTPPSWVFGPVWSVLYVMMGVVAGRLIQRRAWPAVRLFGLQFILNLAWTPVFFGAQQVALALAVIFALWLALLGTILAAHKRDGLSAWLLLPYLAWVSYASYLNVGIFLLNR